MEKLSTQNPRFTPVVSLPVSETQKSKILTILLDWRIRLPNKSPTLTPNFQVFQAPKNGNSEQRMSGTGRKWPGAQLISRPASFAVSFIVEALYD
ncbi:hypothetical protein OUZ56_031107 [Daphnia magna]|uniref:Uncharacterized protein n=1 Tax=Daphnia magna TaxID=35525 RepID=A0ABQ9ZU51_9CRUS|nr:hypothetical protein OUZ56_031107 [Daphnia magna]